VGAFVKIARAKTTMNQMIAQIKRNRSSLLRAMQKIEQTYSGNLD
jgi:hypothetical protein